MDGNCLVAQSGGPTAVINASACGVIREAMKHRQIKEIYAAHNGVLGILEKKIFDLRREDASTLRSLYLRPSSALGTCRRRVSGPQEVSEVLAVLSRYGVRYFFYIGGNDSQDTANMVDELAKTRGHEMRVIGIPKTVDNDLDLTDHCPGYGSVIKYLATMTMETGLDTEASYTSDPVNVIEAIGRDAGWIAGGAALAKRDENDAPHVILLPEIPFAADRVAERLESCLTKIGRAVIVVSEGLKTADGQYVSRRTGQFSSDTFGHPQLGGASDFVRDFVEGTLHVKCRTCRPSIILRNGMHCASLSDCREALHVGERAVQLAVSGVSGKMVTLERLSENPYRCGVGAVDLALVANRIKPVPRDWISADGLSVEDRFIRYAMPLIQGEVRPAMRDGLPDFVRLRRTWVSP